jgi:hypothetical protein
VLEVGDRVVVVGDVGVIADAEYFAFLESEYAARA